MIGNTHLKPEKSTTYQFGFDYGMGKIRFATNFFRNDIQDLIQAEFIGQPRTPEEMQVLLRTFDISSEFNRLSTVFSTSIGMWTTSTPRASRARSS